MDLLDFTPKTDDLVVELEVAGKKLTNPDGSPMTVTVMSPFSAEAKKVTHDLTDERIKKLKQKKNKKNTPEDNALTSAEVDELNLEGLVRTTKDWNITWGGEQPKFSKDMAKEVFTKAFWIKSLIEDARANTLDFMKP